MCVKRMTVSFDFFPQKAHVRNSHGKSKQMIIPSSSIFILCFFYKESFNILECRSLQDLCWKFRCIATPFLEKKEWTHNIWVFTVVFSLCPQAPFLGKVSTLQWYQLFSINFAPYLFDGLMVLRGMSDMFSFLILPEISSKPLHFSEQEMVFKWFFYGKILNGIWFFFLRCYRIGEVVPHIILNQLLRLLIQCFGRSGGCSSGDLEVTSLLLAAVRFLCHLSQCLGAVVLQVV